MANPFTKGWRYLMFWSDRKIDEVADPKVLIEQALEASQKQHHTLVKQAATIIGNQRQIEQQLSKKLEAIEKFRTLATTAALRADQFRGKGAIAEADQYESTALTMATNLAHAEQELEDLKILHAQAESASDQARRQVESNAKILESQMMDKRRLLNQLEQAKLQETVASSLESIGANTVGGGSTPTLNEVREKIEAKYANALGRAELASSSTAGQILEVEKTTLELEGANRLAELRKQLES